MSCYCGWDTKVDIQPLTKALATVSAAMSEMGIAQAIV